MKCVMWCEAISALPVAPHWGAWIEIGISYGSMRDASVAPHWGAWIEIRQS